MTYPFKTKGFLFSGTATKSANPLYYQAFVPFGAILEYLLKM